MTTAKQLPFLTGFCGYSGLHDTCPSVVGGVDCTCSCHQPPTLELVEEPPAAEPVEYDLGDALLHLSTSVEVLSRAVFGFTGSPVELCDLLGQVRRERMLLAEVESLLERDAAAAFPFGVKVLEWEGGTAERRGGKDRKEWRHEDVTRAVTAAIIPGLAVDPTTGEVDQDLAGLLHRAVEEYAATNRPTWRTTALRPLGVDPDDFCTSVPGRATVQVNLATGGQS